ncbi:hypothetical protein [Plantactinospora sp. GCM10030261]|uniref:hypothetical protein n=1 Tax=Plantactinospora sp. GCM10030261 TaxID=3273420 RepID=UPI00360D8EDF
MTQRYVVHLPFTAADLPAALRLARVLARCVARLSPVEPGGTTVSEEDAQHVRHWVFCDALMPGGRRCVLRYGHDGECARRLRR